MHDTWFISDTHFGHANILTYESVARPFENLTQMHEALITRWNSVVRKNDKVFHLGDFCFGARNIAFAELLNGNKHLILGNHDIYPTAEYLKYFKTIHGAMYWKGNLLTHIPVHPMNLERRASHNIHGHLHSKKIDNPMYINVSCEHNNLTPLSADELFKLRGHHEKDC